MANPATRLRVSEATAKSCGRPRAKHRLHVYYVETTVVLVASVAKTSPGESENQRGRAEGWQIAANRARSRKRPMTSIIYEFILSRD